MKNLIIVGLMVFGLNSFADAAPTAETAAETTTVVGTGAETTTVVEAMCLTDAAVAELIEAGWTCAATLAEDGTEMTDAVTCVMEEMADILLTIAACETVTATE